MTKPVRLQLSRRKGFSLQALSLATNGLAAVNVARPTKWGNPYKVGVDGSAAHCVAEFRLFTERPAREITGWDRKVVKELGGKNLACWCGPDRPCHASVLLDLANPTTREPR